jgi:Domain of unknown function (DUF4406)
MNVYLAGPMRGYPEFNYPAFRAAAALLRADGHSVFSPAERDIERHNGEDISVGTLGDLAEIEAKGFNIRDAIFDDLSYIIRHADAIALLPGWETSKGVACELATAEFLDLKVIEL